MKIAIMGFGVVGSGIGEIISSSYDSFNKKCGEKIEIKRILDLRDFPDSKFNCFTKDFNDILNDPEIEIVAEVMGGVKPAYEFTKQLLLAGKSVTTSNKELVAKHGTELLKIAKDKNVNYLFEASVGGGIPIIRPLYSSLVPNELIQIVGILNGTTNYILTKMINSGETFETALKGAQKNGYAEKDPTADVEGFDSCRKTAILASLAFGTYVDSEEISTEGITKITLEDIAYANKFGGVVKLCGITSKAKDGVFAMVCPVILKNGHPLANIDDVFNGILVSGKDIGDVMFYGRGAGSLPTASAVVSDIIEMTRNKGRHLDFGWEDGKDGYLKNSMDREFRYYIRLNGCDDSAFNREGFETIKLNDEKFSDEFAIITPKMTGYELDEFKKAKLNGKEILGCIRLLDE